MNLIFDPLLPIPIVFTIFGALLVTRLFLKINNLVSNIFFFLALSSLLVLAINPLKEQGEKQTLPGIVALLSDETASMVATNRVGEAKQIKAQIEQKLGRDYILKSSAIPNSDGEYTLSQKLDSVLNGKNPKQISGAIILSDGHLKAGDLSKFAFPINQIIIGKSDEFDRNINLVKPAIGVEIGQKASLIIRVEDNQNKVGTAEIELSFGSKTQKTMVKLNEDIKIQIPIEASGKKEIAISTPIVSGEISGVNNFIITHVEGIFDRLRVLLISGEPYEGLRSWRALLKSDPSIDLVHFTILRGPEKEDFAAQNEISLIPFPVEELFYEKLNSFDLIIIDRFMAQDVLRDEYLDNIARFVNEGGALLSVFGVYDTTENGILNTKLGPIIPVSKLPIIENQAFAPQISPNANNHPIVAGFDTRANWGKWDNYFKTSSKDEVILTANGDPLLTLRDQGKGRVGALLSENSWYWARGIDGGGPFRELIGRTVHYLLKDPQFEKKKLILDGDLDTISAKLEGITNPVRINGPEYSAQITPKADENHIKIEANKYGLYQAKAEDLIDFAILGADEKTIGKPLFAKELEHNKYLWGSVLYSRDFGFNLEFRQVENRSIIEGKKIISLLKPSLFASSPERTPIFNRNIILLFAILAFFITWLFEGKRFRR